MALLYILTVCCLWMHLNKAPKYLWHSAGFHLSDFAIYWLFFLWVYFMSSFVSTMAYYGYLKKLKEKLRKITSNLWLYKAENVWFYIAFTNPTLQAVWELQILFFFFKTKKMKYVIALSGYQLTCKKWQSRAAVSAWGSRCKTRQIWTIVDAWSPWSERERGNYLALINYVCTVSITTSLKVWINM